MHKIQKAYPILKPRGESFPVPAQEIHLSEPHKRQAELLKYSPALCDSGGRLIKECEGRQLGLERLPSHISTQIYQMLVDCNSCIAVSWQHITPHTPTPTHTFTHIKAPSSHNTAPGASPLLNIIKDIQTVATSNKRAMLGGILFCFFGKAHTWLQSCQSQRLYCNNTATILDHISMQADEVAPSNIRIITAQLYGRVNNYYDCFRFC